MFTREGITKDVHADVIKQLEKNGFIIDVHNKFKYEKRYEWGTDTCLLPHVRFLPEHINFNLSIDRRIDLIEKIWQEWSSLVNVNVDDPNFIATLYVTEKKCLS